MTLDATSYSVLKALHLIFVVTWFAGLFYLVRLFIYDVEARTLPDPQARAILTQQFGVMQRRLWYAITVPSAYLVAMFGTLLMVSLQAWHLPWFHAKLAMLILLYGYHFHCGILRQRLASKQNAELPTSRQLRVYNEVATLFLVGIVALAVTKQLGVALQLGIGFIAFAAMVFGWLTLRARCCRNPNPRNP